MPHSNTGKRDDNLLAKTYKFRAYPSREQVEALEEQLRGACTLYNAALEERKWAYKMASKSISLYDQTYQVKPIRDDGNMPIASWVVARDVLYRVDLAYQAFFRRLKAGDRPGFPKFRHSRHYDSLTWGNYSVKLPASEHIPLHIRGERSESVRIERHRPINGKVKTAQIKRRAGRWWVYLSVEYPAPLKLPGKDTAIGVYIQPDEESATLSNGRRLYRVPSQKHYQREMDALARVQQAYQRAKDGYYPRRPGLPATVQANRNNPNQQRHWEQYRARCLLRLQRCHEEVADRRLDFWHRLSAEMVRDYQTIAIGRLPPLQEMAEQGYGLEVNDAAWRILVSCLTYKARERGRDLMIIEPDPRWTDLSPTEVAQYILKRGTDS